MDNQITDPLRVNVLFEVNVPGTNRVATINVNATTAETAAATVHKLIKELGDSVEDSAHA